MVLRDSAIYVASRAVPGLVGFATAMLLTWILPPAELGLYGIGMAAAMLGSGLLFEWVSAGFVRWHESHQADPRFVPTILVLAAGTALLPVPAILAAAALGVDPHHLRIAWLSLLGSVASGWFDLSSRVQVVRSCPWRFLAMTLARNGLMLAGVVGAAHLTGSAAAALTAGFLAMAAAGSLFLGDWFSFRPGRFDRALARSLFGFGAPVGLTRALSGLVTSGTPLLLGALVGAGAVAGFTVSTTLVQNTLGILGIGISAALFPPAVRAVEAGDAAGTRQILSQNYALLLGILLPSAAGLALLAPQLADSFVGPALREEVKAIVPWLCAATLLIGLRSYHIDYAFQLGKRTGLLVGVVALGGATSLGLCLALAPSFGAEGAAAGTVAAAAIMAAHAAALTRRVHPVPVSLAETCRVGAAVLAMALVVAAFPLPSGLPGLVAGVALGGAAYAVAYATLDLLGPRRLPRALAGAAERRRRRGAGDASLAGVSKPARDAGAPAA